MTTTEHRQGSPHFGAAPGSDVYRLSAGWLETGGGDDYPAHRQRHGPLPIIRNASSGDRERLVEAVEAAGLRGRGGAGFPTARKIRAVAAGRGPAVVVANGCEGEPVSSKDHALLRLAPHLVIDGAVLAARAVGAAQIYLCVHRGSGDLSRLRRALAERPADEPRIHLVEVPARYVSSEESALVRFLNTGDARPTAKPPRPFESGVGRRPTLIDNVETLAQLALIARHGPDWFRGAGTADSPGTTLVTLSGALHRPGVYEVPLGTAIGSVLGLAGGATGVLQAVLVGGYGGAWLPLPAAESVPLSHEGLRAAGGVLGVGALVALPAGACAIAETAGILRYLAGESARQCGPCMFGLPAIASDMADLVNQGSPAILARLRTRLGVIPGRGACGHPDGAARLAASALQVFEAEAREHAFGRPCFWSKQPTVTAAPLPAPRPEWR